MPNYNATGLVIHRTDLGEYDRVVTLFTREYGKLSVVAKSARRSGSRFSGVTELFTESRVQLATGKTFDILTQCEIVGAHAALRVDLRKLIRATYLCELLDRLTGERDDASSEALFDLMLGALQLLGRAQTYPDAVVHSFELHLLGVQGYAPSTDRCVLCGRAAVSQGAGFSASLGGVVCAADRGRAPDSGAISPDSLAALDLLQNGDASTILQFRPSPTVAAELARALRWYIRYRIDSNLKSGDFLDQLRSAS